MMKITGEVRVSSEEMKRQADEVDKLVSIISDRFSEIGQYMDATGGHWLGVGGDTHRRLYQSQREELANILRRLREHPGDLRKMAGIYDDTERKNVSAAQALPTDAIS